MEFEILFERLKQRKNFLAEKDREFNENFAQQLVLNNFAARELDKLLRMKSLIQDCKTLNIYQWIQNPITGERSRNFERLFRSAVMNLKEYLIRCFN